MVEHGEQVAADGDGFAGFGLAESVQFAVRLVVGKEGVEFPRPVERGLEGALRKADVGGVEDDSGESAHDGGGLLVALEGLAWKKERYEKEGEAA
jgi:hypothetical protein